jgi:tetratricopeptide (TPR) repeat protein
MTADTLRRAREALERGELDEARQRCREYLDTDDNDAAGWRLLGSVETAARDHAAAWAAMDRASRLHPEDAGAVLAAARAAAACGRKNDAIRGFRRAASMAGSQPELVTLAGEGLGNLGCLDDAEECFRKALDTERHHHRARFGLALARLARGATVEAIEMMRGVLEDRPGLAPVWLQLGGALITAGRYAEADAALRRHLELAPDNPVSLTWLGASRQFQGDFDAAESLYRAALGRAPDNVDARANLGKLLQVTSRSDEAATHFRHALAMAPRHRGAASGLAAWLDNHGLHDEALKTLDDSDPDPANPELAPIRARALRHMGRTTDARNLLEAALDRNDLSEDLWIQLRFSLAAVCDEEGDYRMAWRNAELANERKRSLRPESMYRDDLDAMEAAVRELKTVFDAPGIEGMARSGCSSERPVFIVGMPRTGKSLVEQLLCSHPDVRGAGELTAIGDASAAFADSREPWPCAASSLQRPELARQAAVYLTTLDRAAGTGALRVTDTMPFNFVHIGLIEMLFPKARIIHCVRHPADVALRCYLKNFAGRSLSFAFALADIARYLLLYRELMTHWSAVSGLGICHVRYESLVARPEAEADRLIRFLRLDRDASVPGSCEARVAESPAGTQVRRPLHNREVGGWRRYEEELASILPDLPVAEYERGGF